MRRTLARLQVASHPDRMTPFPLLDFIQNNRAAAKYYRRACQNYSFVNIIRHFQLFSMFIYDNR